MASSSSSSSTVVQQLAACFVEDPLIDEYDFVLFPSPSDAAEDATTTAVPFVLEAHKLGIATWALKSIFREALGMFRRISTAAAAKTREGVEERQDEDEEEKETKMHDMATRALLMINPDMYTAWNVRKRLIVRGKLSEVAELAFLDLVFSKHTKKASAWAHRRWCLSRLLKQEDKHSRKDEETLQRREEAQQQQQQQQQQWCWVPQQEKELMLTARIAEIFPKNYYSWTHRWWVVGSKKEEGGVELEDKGRREGGAVLDSSSRSSSSNEKEGQEEVHELALLQQQVDFAREWAGRHVWDMSAVNYLQQVLTRLVSFTPPPSSSSSSASFSVFEGKREQKQREESISLLDSLLDLNAAALDIYPGHESLWYQRRGLLELWLTARSPEEAAILLPSSSSSSSPSSPSSSSSPPPTSSSLSETPLYNCEMERAGHYMRGEGPWEGGEGGGEGGLLWDAAAKRKQKLSAWTHKCWVVLRWRGGGGREKGRDEEKERNVLREELEALEASEPLLFVPPGYRQLVL